MNTETKPTFIHNDIVITLENNGKFSAVGPQGKITSGSLDGIKKRLDKDGVFKPFKAFFFQTLYRGTEIVDCTVVGFVPPRRRFGSPDWKIERPVGGSTTRSEVYEDTPANRAAAKAYLDMVKEHRKVREQQEAAENKALAKLKSRRPEKKNAI